MKPATETPRIRRRATTARRLVGTAFALVGVGIVAATALAFVQTRDLQSGTRTIVDHMTARTHLLEKVDHLVERRRILVDDHMRPWSRPNWPSSTPELTG